MLCKPSRINPSLFPLESDHPDWVYNDVRHKSINHAWGEIKVPVIRLRERHTKEYRTITCDRSLDDSGWTPHALEIITTLSTELPCEIASRLARKLGFNANQSSLDRLTRSLGEVNCLLTREDLEGKAFEPLEKTKDKPRIFSLQADGCHVLGQPTDHKCGGIEVKALVLFATDEPQKREIFAEVCEASTLPDVSSGLFRQANIRQQDDIIGLGGGPARQVL
jgi:hypothetical protein